MKPGSRIALPSDRTKRDLLKYTVAGMGIIGASGTMWILAKSLLPAADTVAPPNEFTVENIPLGEWRIIPWHRAPVIVHHRNQAQISLARSTAGYAKFPDEGYIRSRNPAWFVAVGVCTFRGCILTNLSGSQERQWREGWFCPCCGSEYDLAGRAMIGPAPRNLDVPKYILDKTGILHLG